MTSPVEERAIWDAKAGTGVEYEIWNETNKRQWREDATECVRHIMRPLRPLAVSGARFLEIGCGIGRLTERIAKLCPAVSVQGVDVSERMIAAASAHRSGASYHLCDGRTLEGFEDIDAIYSIVTFQHIPAVGVRSYIKESGRALRTGGLLRFQFVEGDNVGPLSHHYRSVDVDLWCHEAGIEVFEVERGLMFDEWTWMTGWKL